MNGSGGWSMEHLEAIHESDDGLYRCYTVQSGRRYCQPNSTVGLDRCIYKELYRRTIALSGRGIVKIASGIDRVFCHQLSGFDDRLN